MVDEILQAEDRALELYSADGEEAVLACAMHDPACISIIQSLMSGGVHSFYFVKNGYIWQAILAVVARGEFVTCFTVAEELRSRGELEQIGGIDRLYAIESNIVTSMHADTYAALTERLAIKRLQLNIASDIATAAAYLTLDTAETLSVAHDRLNDLLRRMPGGTQVVGGDSLASAAMDEFEAWVNNPAKVRGLSCGLTSIDNLVGGFQPGTVTGILAETSMGKSTLAAGWVRHFAQQGPGIYVPTETPGKIAFHKMALDMAGVPFKQARAGNVPPQYQERAYAAYHDIMLYAHNIKTFDTSAPTMEAIHAQIIQMQAGTGCKWLVIDSGSKFAKTLKIAQAGDNLYKATTLASSFMQDMARLGLAVVSTWQIGRSTKDRPAKEPTLHDAKDSGAVEEDVDVLFGLYRHDYFVARKMAEANPLRYRPGTAKLFLLKDRAGCDGDEEATLDFAGGKGFVDAPEVRIGAKAG